LRSLRKKEQKKKDDDINVPLDIGMPAIMGNALVPVIGGYPTTGFNQPFNQPFNSGMNQQFGGGMNMGMNHGGFGGMYNS